MTYDEFRATCSSGEAPKNGTDLQHALFLDFTGDWDAAHSIAQAVPSVHGSAVHAYLHRKEGDQSNANYWYNRASRTPASGPLEEEWEILARELTD